MRRIVFAVTNDLTHDRRMHRICESLHNAGFRVSLVGRIQKHSGPLSAHPFHQHRFRCFFHKGPLFYIEFQVRLFWYLLFSSAEIFCSCDLDTALAVILAGKLRRKRLVFDAHEHFTEVPEVERRLHIKRIWHAIGRWCIPKFHLRYTVGDALAEILTGEYHGTFHVIRNVPVLEEQAIIPPSDRNKRIVYLGTLNEGRGLEYAIEAMRHLPEYELMLIGEGDLSATLREQARMSGYADRIIFAGWVAPDQLSQTIKTSLLGLNILEARSKSYFYSLSNKFFDYIHAGVPSINMDFPEYSKILQKQRVGLTIPELRAETIAQVVQSLDENPELYAIYVRACEVARLEFCWQREERVLLDLYKNLAQDTDAKMAGPK